MLSLLYYRIYCTAFCTRCSFCQSPTWYLGLGGIKPETSAQWPTDDLGKRKDPWCWICCWAFLARTCWYCFPGVGNTCIKVFALKLYCSNDSYICLVFPPDFSEKCLTVHQLPFNAWEWSCSHCLQDLDQLLECCSLPTEQVTTCWKHYLTDVGGPSPSSSA